MDGGTEMNIKTVTEIEIFDVEGKPVKIKVQRPRIMAMAAQGKIPNPLMGIATKMVSGRGAEQGNIKEMAQMVELYCRACMVEPAYEDMKDSIDDEQMFAIFSWATSEVSKLDNFRNKQKDDTDNNDGKGISKKTK